MSHESENIKGPLREITMSAHGRISELLEGAPSSGEHRQAVVSTVAQTEATLAVARSIEYLAETLRDSSAAQTGQ